MVTQEMTKEKMKDSGVEWIGEIPERWEVQRGKFLFRSKKEANSQMQCDNVLSLTMRGVISRSELGEGGLLPSDYSTFQVFKKDDLVFKLIDLENYKTSRVGLVHERGIMSSAYIRAFPIRKNNIDERFFFYFYFNLYLQGIFNFIGMGVRSTMNAKDLLEMDVIIPSKETQKQISNFLDEKTEKIDGVIEKKKKLIERLKEKRSSLITHAVTKGLDPNAKMKDSGVEWIGKIPEGWEITKSRKIFKVVRGNCNFSKGDLANKGDYVALQYGKTYKINEVNEDFQFYVNKSFYKDSQIVKSGDTVLISTSETIEDLGHSCYYNRKDLGLLGGEQMCLKPKELTVEKFLYYVTRNFKIDLRQCATGIKVYRFKVNDLKKIKIVVPPINEQRRIVDFLDEKTTQIDKTVKKIQSQIKKLQEYRSSLIYHAVTGKIRV